MQDQCSRGSARFERVNEILSETVEKDTVISNNEVTVSKHKRNKNFQCRICRQILDCSSTIFHF